MDRKQAARQALTALEAELFELNEWMYRNPEVGFTERQARFLGLVMRHSGVCVPRQYSQAAGIAQGAKCNTFFDRLVRRGHARAIECVHIPDADAARILKMCLDRKIVAATDATPADVRTKVAAGYRLLSVGWDYAMLQRSLGESVKALRQR